MGKFETRRNCSFGAERIGRERGKRRNPEMLQIKQVLSQFSRPCSCGQIIENKEPYIRKGEEKRGAPKMKVHPAIYLITKHEKSDIFTYSVIFMKTQALNCVHPFHPDMSMKSWHVTGGRRHNKR